jgi:hypothetical protein
MDLSKLCGGKNLCGKDGACKHLACCDDGLTCTRVTSYTWTCKR